MKYTVDYFIKKFEAIPEEMWISGIFFQNGKSCANDHCGMRLNLLEQEIITTEAQGLQKVFSALPINVTDPSYGYSEKAVHVNNGWSNEYKQPTPKQRILAALYDIKKMQSKDIDTATKTKTVYVAVPTTISEQAKELVWS